VCKLELRGQPRRCRAHIPRPTSKDASAGKACSRTKFDSTLVANACKKGGQDEAKKVMKAYLKEAKKKNASLGCPSCHSKVGGDFPLKPDGLKLFKENGGK
jgi:L-lactate utilization protein LutC